MTKPISTSAKLLILPLSFLFFGPLSFAAAPGAGPAPIKKGKLEYSTYTQTQPCYAKVSPACFTDTFVAARMIDNGELVWERRIYFIQFKAESGAKPEIPVTSLKFSGPKTLEVKNKKGDVFTLELTHGHLKKPKDAKKY